MKLIKPICIILWTIGCSTCAYSNEAQKNQYDDELLDFANANCFFWYFKSKQIDTTDIKKISSGIVELSHLSPEKFQQTAQLVKSYNPKLNTKQSTDIQLTKCFLMQKDDTFKDKLRTIYETP